MRTATLILWITLLFNPIARAETLGDWARRQTDRSVERIFKNISPTGTVPGIVVASPSKADPDYFYHWMRDAALVMGVVETLYEKEKNPLAKEALFKRMLEYTQAERKMQEAASHPGEPKFNVDATPFTGPWGRPQNDGPALRAITLMRFLRTDLYGGSIPAKAVIKADLEFVAHNWKKSSFDLWEEVQGHHFYTRAVQRRALVEGAALATELGDFDAASFYREQAEALEVEIMHHWNSEAGYIGATLGFTNGNRGKNSNLDVAVILGVLHGATKDGFLAPSNPPIMATAERIREVFDSEYRISSVNRDPNKDKLGTAIGRYPEDTYDGVGVESKGNPWFLATAAYAEYCYRLAADYQKTGTIKVNRWTRRFLASMVPALKLGDADEETITDSDVRFNEVIKGLRDSGDSFLRRIRFHTDLDGHLSEQYNRDNGYLQGARDLTWSYASFVTAVLSRPNY
jgi:glucoamylase